MVEIIAPHAPRIWKQLKFFKLGFTRTRHSSGSPALRKPLAQTMNHDLAKRAVITVGTGRGFVVAGPREDDLHDRIVITAAHCLPSFPPCASFSTIRERTYPALLGPLGAEPTVWAECLFVDPIGDIAVLGSPDEEDLHREAHDYAVLIGQAAALPIGDAPRSGPAWLLSLKNAWFRCHLTHFGGPLSITDAAEGIVPGMSGSPIVGDDGSAIGVVCCSTGAGDEPPTEGSPNARLNYNLPVWLVRASEL